MEEQWSKQRKVATTTTTCKLKIEKNALNPIMVCVEKACIKICISIYRVLVYNNNICGTYINENSF